jgi:hypothetical protein
MKTDNEKETEDIAQVMECLLCKWETLYTNPVPPKKKKKKRDEE